MAHGRLTLKGDLMAVDLSQNQVIENLNQYLQWHNLPLKMNSDGVCNGLAIIYAKYILEGKKGEFWKLMDYVAGKKISQNEEESVNQFVAEVILSFKPDKYIKGLNQTRAYETQKINNKPLKSHFDLPLVTNDTNWRKIFADINLQNDEVMLVRTPNHTVTISKSNGQYEVYDPNYEDGPKFFSNETDLVTELRKNIFTYSTSEMGLLVSVVSHPEKPVRTNFPKVDSIYQQYLTTNNVSQKARADDIATSTIELAGYFDNADLARQLLVLEKDKDNIFQAAHIAAVNNNPATLTVLLPELNKEQTQIIFLTTLRCGRKEAFDAFIQTESGKKVFDKFVKDDVNAKFIFHNAARGGNPALLQQMIDAFKTHSSDIFGQPFTDSDVTRALLAKTKDKDAVMSAIAGKDPACLRLVLEKVDTVANPLDNRKKLDYLLLAIKKNQPISVQILVENLSPALLQTVSLSLSVIEKTDLGLLNTLQSHGMVFSDKAQAVIAQKKHQSVGLLLSMGIALIKFTDFCREILFKNEGVSCDENKFQFFAQQQKVEKAKVTGDLTNHDSPPIQVN
ncbi:ankyrin repeat-containing protein [Legionella feeleii]|uniref:Ankyrin repeat-containing protein n=2 Tax=Legionella feeleii TaxID=453 RepID=A0A0W0TIJ8_9GAMM|nr:ankyrin repeat-containing protein [Legionella feeleii]